MEYCLWGVVVVLFVFVIRLLKINAHLEKQIDDECYAELEEMREYVSYLEHLLKSNNPVQ